MNAKLLPAAQTLDAMGFAVSRDGSGAVAFTIPKRFDAEFLPGHYRLRWSDKWDGLSLTYVLRWGGQDRATLAAASAVNAELPVVKAWLGPQGVAVVFAIEIYGGGRRGDLLKRSIPVYLKWIRAAACCFEAAYSEGLNDDDIDTCSDGTRTWIERVQLRYAERFCVPEEV